MEIKEPVDSVRDPESAQALLGMPGGDGQDKGVGSPGKERDTDRGWDL